MKSVVIVDWKSNWIPNIKTSVIKCCCNQRHFRASRIYRFQLGNMFPLERIPKRTIKKKFNSFKFKWPSK
jgi:hypothetical protein